MRTVDVTASRNYTVHIGPGLLRQTGTLLKELCKPSKIAIVTDSHVAPLYLDALKESLPGMDTTTFVFPAGEQSKNGQTFLALLNHLAENRLTRSDCLIALGGGVVGDLTGFAAATYLRGVPFVQIPTTLLAAVDSSVGGKTAIDLPAGKNLAGAFYQPRLVLCDTDALNTLPNGTFLEGCAEVIKYAILYDADLFALLRAHGPEFPREEVIARCVAWKRDVVAQDEFDTGLRMKLNLGHTIGHGIEKHSHFTVSHGEAVAAGMAIAARIACATGLCDQETVDEITAILHQFHLPTGTNFTARQLYDAALSDKKRSGSTVTLVLPRRIGACDLVPTPVAQLEHLLEMGL